MHIFQQLRGFITCRPDKNTSIFQKIKSPKKLNWVTFITSISDICMPVKFWNKKHYTDHWVTDQISKSAEYGCNNKPKGTYAAHL